MFRYALEYLFPSGLALSRDAICAALPSPALSKRTSKAVEGRLLVNELARSIANHREEGIEEGFTEGRLGSNKTMVPLLTVRPELREPICQFAVPPVIST